MSQYRHGVYVEEVPTSLVTPVTAESAMPVIVGTAPVHNLPKGATPPVNEPRLIYSMQDFVAQFGEPGEGEAKADYTLYQAAEIYLTRYKVAPLVAINVFDPAKHQTPGTSLGDAVASGSEQIVEGTPESGFAGSDGRVPVTEEDIIGDVDGAGKRSGLALVEEIFPRFRILPGQVLAPRFSADPTVALALGAACRNIAGHFKATGIFDVPDSVTRASDVAAWLNDNNLTDPNLLCMYGNAVYGNDDARGALPSGGMGGSAGGASPSVWNVEPGSIHLAGCVGLRDASNEGVPFWSPSNTRLQCEGLTHAGRELHLSPQEAAYLNGQGIVTGLNMIGGLVAWGDQTTAYPGITDVKDASIPIRRMFTWVGNTLVLTSWQFVSSPIRRRLVETVQDTFNVWLNGLAAREFILGGRVTFEMVDNPTSDLMSGKVRWHVYLCPPQAAREIVFMLEYDPGYLQNLFGVNA